MFSHLLKFEWLLEHSKTLKSYSNVHKSVGSQQFHCVPKHAPVSAIDVEKLFDFVHDSRKMLVLTGAGVSTESGIPDYRSEEVGLYHVKRIRPFKPIQQSEFLSDTLARQRYWLRNYIGWPTFSTKEPNITHLTLSKLEELNKVFCIVTQNVDNLHFKAKSRNVIELHGSAFRVKCLGCSHVFDRSFFQDSLRKYNGDITVKSRAVNPDGDVEIDENLTTQFVVPDCTNCGGIMQPDIVFFGGNVPKERHKLVEQNVDHCDSLLVLGTSLSVFSSYRIILRAYETQKRIAIVNIGKTRGDPLALIKINARCGEIIPQLIKYDI